MIIGMLWFDNSSSTLADKVRKAAEYYQKKYGRAPDLCLVNSQMLSSGTGIPGAEGGVTVRPWRSIPLHHLWIGVEELPEYAREQQVFEEHVRAKDAASVATQLSFAEVLG